MGKNRTITVQGISITISKADIDDYICITDMAAAKSDNSRAADVIKNWLRNRNTLEFLGTWEQIYNQNFKVVEFDHFKQMRLTLKIIDFFYRVGQGDGSLSCMQDREPSPCPTTVNSYKIFKIISAVPTL